MTAGFTLMNLRSRFSFRGQSRLSGSGSSVAATGDALVARHHFFSDFGSSAVHSYRAPRPLKPSLPRSQGLGATGRVLNCGTYNTNFGNQAPPRTAFGVPSPS